jgi:hypothetical protein
MNIKELKAAIKKMPDDVRVYYWQVAEVAEKT